jgi:cyclic di-GMP phosphodiesterase
MKTPIISSASKARILIVDDEPLICAVLTEGLVREGFECSSRTSGQEALKLLELEHFDATISDIRMPGMSGLELLEAVRAKYPRMSILVATAVDNVRVGVEAMKKGADDYLLKPFQLDAVAVAVERALEKKRLELEVEMYRNHLEKMVEVRTKQLQAALNRVELTYDDTLQALGAALDLRDAETEGHSRRVSLYALEIARSLKCSSESLLQIARGSYLHDIGKIGIPDAILRKPGKLSPDEVTIMHTHARIGYELINGIPFLATAAQIVLSHQEAYDGSGYPQRLRGEQIPMGARIFAVADTLDAMTSDRPYRRASSMAKAREEIRRESGRQFDPQVVEAFLTIPEEVWKNIREHIARKRTHKHSLRFEEIVTLALPFDQPYPSGNGDHTESDRVAAGGTELVARS